MKKVFSEDGCWWHNEPSSGGVYAAPRYYAICAKCGSEYRKREMTTLMVKQGVYDTPKTLCHICVTCMPILLEELEISMPE